MIKYLNDSELERACGGVGSTYSLGVAGLDAFIDATGTLPDVRGINAMADPVAGKELVFPPALIMAESKFPK